MKAQAGARREMARKEGQRGRVIRIEPKPLWSSAALAPFRRICFISVTVSGGRVRMDGHTIDDLPLDRDISSREGVSLDYMARVRIAYLMGQNQAMVTQTQFADAKAGALLAFTGLIATRGPGAVVDIEVMTAAMVAVLAFHGAVLTCCIVVLYPRYASHDVRRRLAREERFSWPALSAWDVSDDDFAEFMRGAQLSQLVTSVARSNHALAAILLRKFWWLRAAFALAVADVAMMVARGAVAAV